MGLVPYVSTDCDDVDPKMRLPLAVGTQLVAWVEEATLLPTAQLTRRYARTHSAVWTALVRCSGPVKEDVPPRVP